MLAATVREGIFISYSDKTFVSLGCNLPSGISSLHSINAGGLSCASFILNRFNPSSLIQISPNLYLSKAHTECCPTITSQVNSPFSESNSTNLVFLRPLFLNYPQGNNSTLFLSFLILPFLGCSLFLSSRNPLLFFSSCSGVFHYPTSSFIGTISDHMTLLSTAIACSFKCTIPDEMTPQP
ncbi:unnamed protein product [Acanthosepion pharaonis]|uniref:Uncharacterized protein n=1 Tax=Acanthosepion pharaonis TaxID=158019 RepID=A0A812E4Q7_ACAPH|nr:unnamed protein product [Sepia pharaonis]